MFQMFQGYAGENQESPSHENIVGRTMSNNVMSPPPCLLNHPFGAAPFQLEGSCGRPNTTISLDNSIEFSGFCVNPQQLCISPTFSPQRANLITVCARAPCVEATLRPPHIFEGFSSPAVTYREAAPTDVRSIIAMRSRMDMTGAHALLWDEEEMAERIVRRDPMLVVAVAKYEGPVYAIVGVAGIDVRGMDAETAEENRIQSLGSRLVGYGAELYQQVKTWEARHNMNTVEYDAEVHAHVPPPPSTEGAQYVPLHEQFVFPQSFCLCRGMLVHPDFQGMGIASNLHKSRLQLLAKIAPHTPGVLIGGRAVGSFERAAEYASGITVGYPYPPAASTSDGSDCKTPRPHTPRLSKADTCVFTYHSAHGIVHMVHERGWKLAGIFCLDGGPLWVADRPLLEMVKDFAVPIEDDDTVAHTCGPSHQSNVSPDFRKACELLGSLESASRRLAL